MKKGFVNQYGLVLFLSTLILVKIYQIHNQNLLMLKKHQQTHLLKIKIYQLAKRHEDFDVMFLNSHLIGKWEDHKLTVSFLDNELSFEYDDASESIKKIAKNE